MIEGYKTELKEGFNTSIGKDICAFANSSGGKIVLGIKDNGIVKGFKLTNSKKSRIQDIARNMDPSFKVYISEKDNLVIIEVPEGTKKPYSINGHFYMRNGANSQQLKRDEIREFFKSEGLLLFDDIPNKKFDFNEHFNNTQFENYLSLAGITLHDKNSILQNLGLMENGFLLNAGVLLFCKKHFFIHSSIVCVLFEGTSPNIIDKKEYNADLISNFENAYKFILSKLNTKFIIEKLRKEKLELPKEAIREALMNALIHRDYFIKAHVQVNIFIDKLEITNPGGLIKGITTDNLGEKSITRNPLLFSLLSRTKYVEKAGTGIKRIKDSMKEYDLEVRFDSDTFFTITFEREALVSNKNASEKTSEKTSEKIISLIKIEPSISAGMMAKKIGISQRAVEMQISKLKKQGKIKRIGPDKGGYWKIGDSA